MERNYPMPAPRGQARKTFPPLPAGVLPLAIKLILAICCLLFCSCSVFLFIGHFKSGWFRQHTVAIPRGYCGR